MNNLEQVANVKKALDLSVAVSRAKKKYEDLTHEVFRARPSAPVR